MKLWAQSIMVNYVAVKIMSRVINFFYHNWQLCCHLIGQFAVVDKSTNNAAYINVSCNGHALKESFFNIDIVTVLGESTTVLLQG